MISGGKERKKTDDGIKRGIKIAKSKEKNRKDLNKRIEKTNEIRNIESFLDCFIKKKLRNKILSSFYGKE